MTRLWGQPVYGRDIGGTGGLTVKQETHGFSACQLPVDSTVAPFKKALHTIVLEGLSVNS